MKRVYLLLLVLCLIFPMGFAASSEFSDTSSGFVTLSSLNEVNSGDFNNFQNIDSDEFLHWSCDSSVAGTMFKFDGDACYCVDMKATLGEYSVGVGNLKDCLEDDKRGILKLLNGVNPKDVNYKIKVFYEENSESVESTVEIKSISNMVAEGSYVECVDDYSGTLNKKYVLYSEEPFRVLDTSFNGVLKVPGGLRSGNKLKCRVLYYEDSYWRDYEDSDNSLDYVVENISVGDVYMAPAFPTVNDTLYCYATPYFEFTPQYMADKDIVYYLSLLKNGVEVESLLEYKNDFLSVSKEINYSLYGSSKGDEFSCEFHVALLNESRSNVMQYVSKYADNVTIQNFKPIISNLNTLVKSFQLGYEAFTVYGPDPFILAKFSDKGVVRLSGVVMSMEDCILANADLVFEVKDASQNVISAVDSEGNFCGEVTFDSNCAEGYVNVKDSSDDVKLSFSDSGMCYEGYLFEEAEFS